MKRGGGGGGRSRGEIGRPELLGWPNWVLSMLRGDARGSPSPVKVCQQPSGCSSMVFSRTDSKGAQEVQFLLGGFKEVPQKGAAGSVLG